MTAFKKKPMIAFFILLKSNNGKKTFMRMISLKNFLITKKKIVIWQKNNEISIMKK